MMEVLQITSDFENTQAVVIGAMLYPQNAEFRAAYSLRNQWAASIAKGGEFALSAETVQAFLDLPSRNELALAAVAGVKHGTVAGDLLSLIYEQRRQDQSRPSMRAALKRYRAFAVGKKYGDGDALKYSDMQLRTYFSAAAPSAHLWAAHRLLKRYKDRGVGYKTAFMPEGMPLLLGLARELQDFAVSFIPKGTKPAKPIIDADNLLLLPEAIQPIKPELRPL